MYHKIHPFIVYSSLVHTVVQWSLLSNSRTFSSPQKETLYRAVTHFPFPLPPSPQTLAASNLPSVFMDFPIFCFFFKFLLAFS